jgi:hypothetical protein
LDNETANGRRLSFWVQISLAAHVMACGTLTENTKASGVGDAQLLTVRVAGHAQKVESASIVWNCSA